MSLKGVLRLLGLGDREPEEQLRSINDQREQLRSLSDHDLRTKLAQICEEKSLASVCAAAALIAERLLGLRMFDVQLQGTLALARGEIAEMQTGEGKTLAAVPAVIWYALRKRGVHVLTANDYLARRDAEWMRGIYEGFGLTVAHIAQGMSAKERRAAYACDITYATANEVGFDYLRDGLALAPNELVHRPFAFAVIDEVDSILIDEARIPLVIAGGLTDDPALACRVDKGVAGLRAHAHYVVDEFARNVQLTDSGIRQVEVALRTGNLFDPQNLRVLTAVQDALHARVLLRRDVDYVVKAGALELVDEFKGRVAQNRRWPAGLQSAIEAKEGVPLKTQGRILGSITVQALAGLYERICGMTGTAATQADEFWRVYKLPVCVISTNRPMIRRDLPDVIFPTKPARDAAVAEEIRRVHIRKQPVLVGTASVEESERLSNRLHAANIPHSVLNARNDEAEAEIIAQAGALGAVTISTNMAGRGTDILLGGNPQQDRERVVELGGLYVIGTTRHEARRIDHQLRGRAGRQGDPGQSRFFISLQDDLLVRFGIQANPDVESVQRTAESQSIEIRQLLWKYDTVVEQHRREMQAWRREILLSPDWSVRPMLETELYVHLGKQIGESNLEREGRRLALFVMDDLWADYLANVAELRGGIHWVSWAGRDPLYEFLKGERAIFEDFLGLVPSEVKAAFEAVEIVDGQLKFSDGLRLERGATWTYLTTDEPFGKLGERIMKGLRRKVREVLRR